MSNNSLNRRIFSWRMRACSVSCKNVCLLQLFDNCHLHSAKHVVAEVVDEITIRHKYEWQMAIDKKVRTNMNSRN